MSLRRPVSTLSVALAVMASSPWAIGQGHVLRHDPFARPFLGVAPQAGGPGVRARPTQGTPEPKRRLKLHAIIVAGPNSIANVDGVIVRVGESVHGYRLLAVQDRSAVFEKNNAKFTLDIDIDPRSQEPARPPAGAGDEEARVQPVAAEGK